MPYNVRDLFGHFIRPASKEGAKCPHPCCNGQRVHPENLPVMLSKSTVRRLSDSQLVEHADKPEVINHKWAEARVMREMDRRLVVNERRAATRARASKNAKDKRAAKQSTYRLWLEGEWVNAERATRGNMVNKRGRAKGIDPRALWTANAATRNAYASDELKSYWDTHPVRTAQEFSAYEDRDEAAVNAHNKKRAQRRLYGIY